MRKALSALVAAVGLLLTFPVAAAADHAPEWVANQDSAVVNETTVHLQGDNTSIETGAELWNLADGDEVSFDYVLHDGAKCEAGAPRVFVQPNGITNKSVHCDGTGSPDASGSVSFTVADAGLVERVGLVYDSGRPGYVEISNLVIGGEPVHFMNPEPEPVPTETPDPTTEPTSEPTPEPTKDGDSKDAPVKDESADESESTTDDTTPAATQETLPDTGVSPLLLVGVGVALILVGGAAALRRRIQ